MTKARVLALFVGIALLIPLPTVVLAEHPHPTVTLAPPEVAFEPLMSTGNLLRVWRFDPATQNDTPYFGWFLYDPRPLYVAGSTITLVEAGQFFWIRVQENKTAAICGRDRTFFTGWNPMTC